MIETTLLIYTVSFITCTPNSTSSFLLSNVTNNDKLFSSYESQEKCKSGI